MRFMFDIIASFISRKKDFVYRMELIRAVCLLRITSRHFCAQDPAIVKTEASLYIVLTLFSSIVINARLLERVILYMNTLLQRNPLCTF